MNLILDLSVDRLSGQDIFEIRQNLGWSREKLARILCISAQSIVFWENGKRQINEENQRRLLELIKHIDKLNQDQKKEKEQ